ncbi:hypothetical protein V3N99_19015 [Dermatophilaceae bacterium Soc4.6]
MRKGTGSVRTRVDSVLAPGLPLLLLHGQAAIGSVTVRRPRHLERRAAGRLLRQRGDDGSAHRSEPTGSVAGAESPQDASAQDWDRRP